jgi:hypothetical protein
MSFRLGAPYKVHVNVSKLLIKLSDTVKSWPSSLKASWWFASFRINFNGPIFPFPAKALTESHPVKACRPGRARQTDCPSLVAILFTCTILTFVDVPDLM